MLITPSFKKSLMVEEFQGNYLKLTLLVRLGGNSINVVSSLPLILHTCGSSFESFSYLWHMNNGYLNDFHFLPTLSFTYNVLLLFPS